MRSACETPCLVMPIRFAIEMLDIPLRRIFQNLNCLSFMGRNMCKCMDVYNIKFVLPSFIRVPETQIINVVSMGVTGGTVISSQV
jgi:hypothetical protein